MYKKTLIIWRVIMKNKTKITPYSCARTREIRCSLEERQTNCVVLDNKTHKTFKMTKLSFVMFANNFDQRLFYYEQAKKYFNKNVERYSVIDLLDEDYDKFQEWRESL